MSIEIEDIPAGTEAQEKRLLLTNAHWTTLLDIGSSWSTIRFGWRWAAAATGLQMPDPQAYMGMMTTPSAGVTDGPLGINCPHFYGLRRINANNFTSGTPGYWVTSWVMSKKVGATITSATPSTTQAYISEDPSLIRTAHFLEITKGSPNFTITHVTCAGVAAFVDVDPRSVIEDALEETTIADVAIAMNAYIGGSGTRYVNSAISSIAVDEATNGYLTSFVAGWPLQNALYISDWIFKKIA